MEQNPYAPPARENKLLERRYSFGVAGYWVAFAVVFVGAMNLIFIGLGVGVDVPHSLQTSYVACNALGLPLAMLIFRISGEAAMFRFGPELVLALSNMLAWGVAVGIAGYLRSLFNSSLAKNCVVFATCVVTLLIFLAINYWFFFLVLRR